MADSSENKPKASITDNRTNFGGNNNAINYLNNEASFRPKGPAFGSFACLSSDDNINDGHDNNDDDPDAATHAASGHSLPSQDLPEDS